MKITKAYASAILAVLFLGGCDKNSLNPSRQAGVSGNIETIAGLGPSNFGYDGNGGPAKSAKLGWLTSVTVDADDNVYVTDGASNTVRKINASTSNDVINTIAGTFLGFNVVDPTPFAGDGGAATSAHLNVPLASTVDASGNVFIVDAGNGVLRKVSAVEGTIYTIAGKPRSQGYEGDGNAPDSASFWNLYSVAVDTTGNIFLADGRNNAIRKISKETGKITTIAGQGPDHAGYSGDNGQAVMATLDFPRSIAVDSNGDIYFGDDSNHVIRKIAGGVITTVAGSGTAGFSGDGGPALSATFTSLSGLALDVDHNIYFADAVNNTIRKITASTGIISLIAGGGAAGYAGDGGPAVNARLSGPWGVAVDSQGNVYIADTGNSVIRVVIK